MKEQRWKAGAQRKRMARDAQRASCSASSAPSICGEPRIAETGHAYKGQLYCGAAAGPRAKMAEYWLKEQKRKVRRERARQVASAPWADPFFRSGDQCDIWGYARKLEQGDAYYKGQLYCCAKLRL